MKNQTEPPVLIHRHPRMLSLVLNRPRVLNSLDIEMVRRIQAALDEVEAAAHLQFVLLSGAGDRGFCAGGDIKALANAIRQKAALRADMILKEEYDLCLRLHRFPKPVIAIADGITMGAGLGLAAAADVVVATERTRMAMPETRIGFFPDVGSTGWLFAKCPPGYPEYLGLTGYELVGAEAVRVGLATHLTGAERLPRLIEALESFPAGVTGPRPQAARELAAALEGLFDKGVAPKPEMDAWVKAYFAGQQSVIEIMASLRQCGIQEQLCDLVFKGLSERSPTGVVLTLKLLRHNEHRPLEDVFASDLRAARFILEHPDFVEGVRARLIDKDDNPGWRPMHIEEVGDLELQL